MTSRSLLAVTLLVASACSHRPDTAPEPEMRNASIATNVPAPIRQGDCAEANRRAAGHPEIDVDKVASPISMTPPPLDMRKAPKGVADKNGWFNVKFHVLVDTLGRADMKTFAVDSASHPWLGTSVKTAVAKWKFAPAELAGCKVPRNYSLGISPKGKKPAKRS